MKTNLYRNFLLGVIAAIGLLACPIKSAAISMTISNSYYVGSINDGIPPSGEAGYINALITLAPNTGDTVIGSEIYNRFGSTLVGLPMVTGVTVKDETGGLTINTMGWTYVLGKYDASQAGSLVWYLGGTVDEVTLPATYNGKALSHISLYNLVPDGGSGVALLGIALVGIDYLRRKLIKA